MITRSRRTRRDFLKIAGAAALGAGVILAESEKSSFHAAVPKSLQKQPVKIGVMIFEKGIAAILGVAAWRACQIWRDQINADGGILGRKVELHLEEESSAKDTVESFK